ncbi:MAG: oxygen-independent coproporphyrinogen III oxidase [Cytophagaceae bacterium]
MDNKICNSSNLIQKYNTPTPRYTSYPTVPYWEKESINEEKWLEHVAEVFDKSDNISLYIHLPFCEQLCTYCGCNKRITVNHQVEQPYIDSVLKEWKIYLKHFSKKPVITELHLGGGTPTFFSPENLERLLTEIYKDAIVPENAEYSVEVHPNYTKKEHLTTLHALGFRRLSVGIQDFDIKVQFAINRIQSFEQTKRVFDDAREVGFTSINGDIIYGLPFQSLESIKHTVEAINKLRPERIAFYSYAHVPWKSKAQRRYSEENLPSDNEKRELYEFGRNLLTTSGYAELGMDHFALPQDELHKAKNEKRMHRNFMGYTTQNTNLLIGLGASSIGDTWDAFMQNTKEVEEYEKVVNEGRLPVYTGHILTEEDLYIRRHILNLMCNFQTSWDIEYVHPSFAEGLKKVREFEKDGLVIITPQKLEVTEEGKPFIRNICMCFDARLWRKVPDTPVFSKSI